MTARMLAHLRELEAERVLAADIVAYERRPSRWCADCGLEFSDAVALVHKQRTGHRLLAVGRAA
jgi:hypothetical protein